MSGRKGRGVGQKREGCRAEKCEVRTGKSQGEITGHFLGGEQVRFQAEIFTLESQYRNWQNVSLYNCRFTKYL